MPTNDREVFEALTGASDQPSATDFLTYALFAFERRQWIAHKMTTNGGTAPTQAEIDTWVADISPYQFEQMRSRAIGTFDVAARTYMADDIEQARQDTLRTAVVREVKAAGNFWRQLFIALTTAILAPVIIGLIVVAFLRSEDYLPTIRGTKGAVEAPAAPAQPKGTP